MTSKSENATGQRDIEALLDLLNASELGAPSTEEALEQQTDDVSDPIVGEPATPEAGAPKSPEQPSVHLSQITVQQDVGHDDAENRFAAHIVRGLSKLKRD